MRYLIAITIITTATSCSLQKTPKNKLLSVTNIESFFNEDYSSNFNYLISHSLTDQRNVKSISVYRYVSVYQKYLLEDSILLDKQGKPILQFKRSDIREYSRTHFFYDGNDNGYLEVTISSNNHDTTYVLRRFDKFNRVSKELTYNKTRKEFGRIYVTNISPTSDSEMDIRFEFYEPDLKHENILPFETRDIKVKILNDSIVQTNTNRIVQSDTAYNSTYARSYKIVNNTLIPIDEKPLINAKVNAECFETRYNKCYIKRTFDFYAAEEEEIKNAFAVNSSVVQLLNEKIGSLPVLAWEKYKNDQNSQAERSKILESRVKTDSIELKESSSLESFSPQLWHLVSRDSGRINGFNNMCYVVGYNTPLKNKNDFNKRCLAVYERENGAFVLRKQSFGALEDFVDHDNDLIFNDFDEAAFSVGIEDGNIFVSYNYMRGEASYIFSYENKNWVLTRYESTHRTCCQAEFYSYDYKTQKYHFSILGIGDNTKGDTSVTVIQKRPIVYMDSINIRGFDYSETGLIAK